jgi:AcrR family transcriptional regulator
MAAEATQTVAEIMAGPVDPRIRRTRLLLHQALDNLLKTKDFDKISVQDIAEAATLNRATFYDHYADKFALLECHIAMQFNDLLAQRGITFDGTCNSALRAIVLGVCDFLAATPRLADCERQRQMEPHLESAVIAIVTKMILDGLKAGLKQHPTTSLVSPEMAAATASWAIYGAAKEWLRTPDRGPAERTADLVLTLVDRILAPVADGHLLPHHV